MLISIGLFLILLILFIIGFIYKTICLIDLNRLKHKLKNGETRIKLSKFPNIYRKLFGIDRILKHSGSANKDEKLRRRIRYAKAYMLFSLYGVVLLIIMIIVLIVIGSVINSTIKTTIYTSKRIIDSHKESSSVSDSSSQANKENDKEDNGWVDKDDSSTDNTDDDDDKDDSSESEDESGHSEGGGHY